MGLKLIGSQTNDAKIFSLKDASTWGSDGIPTFATFKANMTEAYISVKYKTPVSDGWIEVLPYIDIMQIFTDATTEDDLVYNISSVEVGLGPDIPLPDGIWSIGYFLTDNVQTYSFDSEMESLLDNIIQAEVYKKVARVNTKYYCANNHYTNEVSDALLTQSLYDSMNANAYVGKKEELLTILEVLQRQVQ